MNCITNKQISIAKYQTLKQQSRCSGTGGTVCHSLVQEEAHPSSNQLQWACLHHCTAQGENGRCSIAGPGVPQCLTPCAPELKNKKYHEDLKKHYHL